MVSIFPHHNLHQITNNNEFCLYLLPQNQTMFDQTNQLTIDGEDGFTKVSVEFNLLKTKLIWPFIIYPNTAGSFLKQGGLKRFTTMKSPKN